MPKRPDWIEDLYTFLSNEEDARVCKAISDDACREVPGNFFLILLSNSLTKIGDRLANPKTTLAWILQAVGAPAFFTGIIVPLRESGSLLPQLLIAGFIRRMSVRKWVWVTGSLMQALCVAGMAFTAMSLTGMAAGWALVGLLAAFSLSRGLCSIASKDVMGKTIPKTRRGRIKGLMGSVSGFVAMAAGLVMIFQAFQSGESGSMQLYTLFLFVAAGLWAVAASIYALVREFPGETSGGGNAAAEAMQQLKLLREDKPFRNFVFVRALAFGSGLSAPFIVSLAHGRLGGATLWLGVFIAADGLAALLASPILGSWADRSSRNLLRYSMLAVAGVLVAVSIFSVLKVPDWSAQSFYPCVFFALGILHSGVRLGRKTYLVDMAEGNKRTSYVAVSNTLIGVLLLAAGLLTGLVALLSVQVALGLFAAAAVLGWWLGRQLPEVSEG